jgi:hypothetical protein
MSEKRGFSYPAVMKRREKPTDDDMEKAKELLKIKGPWEGALEYLLKITRTEAGYSCLWCDYSTTDREEFKIHLMAHLIHELPVFIASMERVGEWNRRIEEMRLRNKIEGG